MDGDITEPAAKMRSQKKSGRPKPPPPKEKEKASRVQNDEYGGGWPSPRMSLAFCSARTVPREFLGVRRGWGGLKVPRKHIKHCDGSFVRIVSLTGSPGRQASGKTG